MVKRKKKLEQWQIDLVEESLKNYESLILTQKIWNEISEKLQLTKSQYASRSHLSCINIPIGYSFEEYEIRKHSTKAFIQIKCIYCNNLCVLNANMLLRRRKFLEVCNKCYVKHEQYDDEWKRKNSEAQKIAQNRPDVIEKHRNNSKLLWKNNYEKMHSSNLKMVQTKEYREKMAHIMKNKWASDETYRDKVSGKGVYKHTGNYHEIVYHSKLELAFLIYCQENNINVLRFNLKPIQYIDPNDGVERNYFPDFIINNNEIIEIKGMRWVELSNGVFDAKINALSDFCKYNKFSYKVIYDQDLKHYRKKADLYHEAQKQKFIQI